MTIDLEDYDYHRLQDALDTVRKERARAEAAEAKLEVIKAHVEAFYVDVAHSLRDPNKGGQHTGPSGASFHCLNPGTKKSLRRYADEMWAIVNDTDEE